MLQLFPSLILASFFLVWMWKRGANALELPGAKGALSKSLAISFRTNQSA